MFDLDQSATIRYGEERRTKRISMVSDTRSSSRFAALLLGPCGAGTLASRAGGPSAPMSGLRPHAFSTYPAQISQIRHGKSPLSQPALIVSDPVQISQICHGKSPISQPALIVSDPVQISQIRHGKSTLSRPFSVTNLGSPDRV